MSLHEDFRRTHEVARASERSFGLVMAAVFTIVGLAPLVGAAAPRWWSLAAAAVLAILGMALPRGLSPFNRLWFAFGLVLHKVMTPLVMGILFYGAVTPVALLMRVFGKDPLRRQFEPEAKTYWITREPPGPDPDSMRDQF